jgi:hypothetical protein
VLCYAFILTVQKKKKEDGRPPLHVGEAGIDMEDSAGKGMSSAARLFWIRISFQRTKQIHNWRLKRDWPQICVHVLSFSLNVRTVLDMQIF